MNRAIHRVALPLIETQTLQLRGFKPGGGLHVFPARMQIIGREKRDVAFELWYEVDADLDEVFTVAVHIVGTGHQFHHDGDYVGTFMTNQGDFVWHVYVEYPVMP